MTPVSESEGTLNTFSKDLGTNLPSKYLGRKVAQYLSPYSSCAESFCVAMALTAFITDTLDTLQGTLSRKQSDASALIDKAHEAIRCAGVRFQDGYFVQHFEKNADSAKGMVAEAKYLFKEIPSQIKQLTEGFKGQQEPLLDRVTYAASTFAQLQELEPPTLLSAAPTTTLSVHETTAAFWMDDGAGRTATLIRQALNDIRRIEEKIPSKKLGFFDDLRVLTANLKEMFSRVVIPPIDAGLTAMQQTKESLDEHLGRWSQLFYVKSHSIEVQSPEEALWVKHRETFRQIFFPTCLLPYRINLLNRAVGSTILSLRIKEQNLASEDALTAAKIIQNMIPLAPELTSFFDAIGEELLSKSNKDTFWPSFVLNGKNALEKLTREWKESTCIDSLGPRLEEMLETKQINVLLLADVQANLNRFLLNAVIPTEKTFDGLFQKGLEHLKSSPPAHSDLCSSYLTEMIVTIYITLGAFKEGLTPVLDQPPAPQATLTPLEPEALPAPPSSPEKPIKEPEVETYTALKPETLIDRKSVV